MKMFYEEKLIKSENKEHETDEEFDILKNFDEIDDRLECLYTAMEIGEPTTLVILSICTKALSKFLML